MPVMTYHIGQAQGLLARCTFSYILSHVYSSDLSPIKSHKAMCGFSFNCMREFMRRVSDKGQRPSINVFVVPKIQTQISYIYIYRLYWISIKNTTL